MGLKFQNFLKISYFFSKSSKKGTLQGIDFSHPCLSDPVRIFQPVGIKLRSQMPTRTENPLFLTSGDFKFYCLQFKNPVGIPKILLFFSSGNERSMYFSNGDGILGYFSHQGALGTNFGPFSVGRGSHRVCDTGVFFHKLEIFSCLSLAKVTNFTKFQLFSFREMV